MSETTQLKVFVKGNRDLTDVVMSRADGGTRLDAGLAERVSRRHPSVSVVHATAPSEGFGALRAELQTDSSSLLEFDPDVVLLSVADDIQRIQQSASEDVGRQIWDDLVGAIGLIKEKAGAHILVTNAATIAPGLAVHNYSKEAGEPFSLADHRMAYMLVRVSHAEGISIVDVDTLLAGLGGAKHVEAAMVYSDQACAVVADEVVRILEDYGFFDERSLIEQVGAGRS